MAAGYESAANDDGSVGCGSNDLCLCQCRIEGITVVGEDVQVKDEKFINGGLILPHKAISTNIPEPGTIVM